MNHGYVHLVDLDRSRLRPRGIGLTLKGFDLSEVDWLEKLGVELAGHHFEGVLEMEGCHVFESKDLGKVLVHPEVLRHRALSPERCGVHVDNQGERIAYLPKVLRGCSLGPSGRGSAEREHEEKSIYVFQTSANNVAFGIRMERCQYLG